MTRVVLDAGAVPHFLEHLEIIVGAAFESGCLQHLAPLSKLLQPLLQLNADVGHGSRQFLSRSNKVLGRIDVDFGVLLQQFAGKSVDLYYSLDLVAEEFNAHGLLFVGRLYFQYVAANSELASGEIDVISLVLHFDEAAGDPVAVVFLALLQPFHKAVVLLG